MSHDQGSSPRRELPELGRPSLFADMAPQDTSAPERVRILSTLNHNVPPSKRASQRNGRTRTGGSTWQFKALLGLMGLGIGGLLIGFALVVAQGHPDASNWQHRAQGPEVTETGAQAAHRPAQADATVHAAAKATLSSTPVLTAALQKNESAAPASIAVAASALQVAVIEELPVAASLAAVPVMVAALPSSQPAAHLVPERAAKVAAASKVSETRPRKSVAKPAPDDDVLLLEAMFAHGKRPGNPNGRRIAP